MATIVFRPTFPQIDVKAPRTKGWGLGKISNMYDHKKDFCGLLPLYYKLITFGTCVVLVDDVLVALGSTGVALCLPPNRAT